MKRIVCLCLCLLLALGCVGCGNSATEGFAEILWPTTNEVVSRLPVPETTFGEISSEQADYFSVDLGNVTVTQFNAYVSACQEKGFTVDYSKSSGSFSAYDAEGYYVWVNYDSDNSIMDIMARAPEEEASDSDSKGTDVEETATPQKSSASVSTFTTTTTTVTTTTTTTTKADDGISSDFKKAMDSYESFKNEYVDFMKRYQENPADLSLLSDYADYISKYADFCEDFAEWENEDLNTEEMAYYVDVQARVSKKLLEVA